jgi:hypothetical protein
MFPNRARALRKAKKKKSKKSENGGTVARNQNRRQFVV